MPIASAPPAASKKKWFPVPTITSSITAGYVQPINRTMRFRATRPTVTPTRSA
jgi:hypothetical protein